MNPPHLAALVLALAFLLSCEDKIKAGPKKSSRASNPIVEQKGLTSTDQAFTDSSPEKPVKISSLNEAKLYFSGKDLVKLSGSVDFTKQIVLLFAWKGSSRDKIEFTVAESYPEQIRFTYLRGKTRDRRPHTRVYVLRKNVKWNMK